MLSIKSFNEPTPEPDVDISLNVDPTRPSRDVTYQATGLDEREFIIRIVVFEVNTYFGVFSTF